MIRRSEAGFALIDRPGSRRPQCLLQWNTHWRAFNLVGGHRRSGESFRDCVIREVEEELCIRHEVDFSVASSHRANLDTVAWSRRAGAETCYKFVLFDVKLLGSTWRTKIASCSENRWANERELAARKFADDLDISEAGAEILRVAGWMSSPHSERSLASRRGRSQ